MNTPQRWGDVPPGATWAADNGRFGDPAGYDDESYLAWLDRQPRARCLFATAPDVVGDHRATVEMSLPMLPRIRALGFPAALVAQDGWREEDVPWDAFDVLFIGGTTGFKLGAGEIGARAAIGRGKPVHMGRVNSFTRLQVAAKIGCSSADGTFLKFAPDHNEKRMIRWLDRLSALRFLPLGGDHP